VVVPPPVEPGPVVDLTPRPPEDTYVATPGLSPQRRSGQADDGECGFLAQRVRITDCEHQCGKAHQLTSCVFDFRKCQIEARSSTQPQRERDLCDLDVGAVPDKRRDFNVDLAALRRRLRRSRRVTQLPRARQVEHAAHRVNRSTRLEVQPLVFAADPAAYPCRRALSEPTVQARSGWAMAAAVGSGGASDADLAATVG
jgi:hypothetical protein